MSQVDSDSFDAHGGDYISAPLQSDSAQVADALMTMCPESMRDMFAPMVQMAIAQIPSESLSSLANDLQSARNADGEVDIDKLIAVGKQFGLTDEMIVGYQASYAAMVPVAE